VYERLVRENDRDPPDLVISGMSISRLGAQSLNYTADTVVIFPPERDTADGERAHGETSEILEKPINEEEQVRF
jgi:septum formation protein